MGLTSYPGPVTGTMMLNGEPVVFAWGAVRKSHGRVWLELCEEWPDALLSGLLDVVVFSVEPGLIEQFGDLVADGVMSAMDPHERDLFCFTVADAEEFGLGPNHTVFMVRVASPTQRVAH